MTIHRHCGYANYSYFIIYYFQVLYRVVRKDLLIIIIIEMNNKFIAFLTVDIFQTIITKYNVDHFEFQFVSMISESLY